MSVKKKERPAPKNRRRVYIALSLALLACAALLCALLLAGRGEFYIIDGGIYKKSIAIDEQTLISNIHALNAARARYFSTSETYYAFIPDKSLFTKKPALDHDRIVETADREFFAVYSISLFETLSARDYYYTDEYWRQECLQAAVNRLGQVFGFDIHLEEFDIRSYPYTGKYARLSDKKHNDDLLFTLINLDTRSAQARDLLTGQSVDIYAPELLGGDSPFSIYLGGPRALTEITNPEAENDRRLIVFGDDFSRPLIPLLLHAYPEIVLIDLRHIGWEDLGAYLNFENADLLYLYSVAGIGTQPFK